MRSTSILTKSGDGTKGGPVEPQHNSVQAEPGVYLMVTATDSTRLQFSRILWSSSPNLRLVRFHLRIPFSSWKQLAFRIHSDSLFQLGLKGSCWLKALTSFYRWRQSKVNQSNCCPLIRPNWRSSAESSRSFHSSQCMGKCSSWAGTREYHSICCSVY